MPPLRVSFLRVEGLEESSIRPFIRVVVGNQESTTPIGRPLGSGAYQLVTTCGGFDYSPGTQIENVIIYFMLF